MPGFRFLHAADLHLDSPLRGLEADPSAPADAIRSASRRALEQLVRLAIDEEASFVLVAGDVYDGDWPDYGAGLFFAAQTRKLADAGIPIFAIRGNHDAANRMTKSLRMPHVTTFDHRRAHSDVSLEALGVAIHGQSFAEQAVTDDLSRSYPAPIDGMFNIGLLHTSAEGHAGHQRYAPCDVARLRAHGYDYWALGHVHTRTVLSEEPWIVFPGNLQGRHIGEAGPKGASLVEVADGRVRSVEHRDLDVLRWIQIEVDATGAADEDDAMARVRRSIEAAVQAASPRPVAARLTLSGATAAHGRLAGSGLRDKVRSEAVAIGCDELLWLESVCLRTRQPSGFSGRPRSGSLGHLLDDLDAIADAPPAELLGHWPSTLLGKLDDALPADHPLRDCAAGDLSAIVEEARRRLGAALEGQDACD